jgi:hypothetical protein
LGRRSVEPGSTLILGTTTSVTDPSFQAEIQFWPEDMRRLGAVSMQTVLTDNTDE